MTPDKLLTFDSSVDSPIDQLAAVGIDDSAVEARYQFDHENEGGVVALPPAVDDAQALSVPGSTGIVQNVTMSLATAPEMDYASVDGKPPVDFEEYAFLTAMGDSVAPGEGITIPITDSGIDPEHQVFDDHEGEITGVDFTGGDSPLTDDVGHGTAVAGLVSKLAPHADLVSFKVFGSTGVTTADRLLKVYNDLLANPDQYDIVNMSLGLSRTISRFNELHNRVVGEGVRIISAAGNSGGDAGTPATATSSMSAGSIAEDGSVSDFSAYEPGDTTVPDVMAPGELIRLADSGAHLGQHEELEGPWTMASGTSFACPIAVGAVARAYSTLARSDAELVGPARTLEAYRSNAAKVADVGESDAAGVINQRKTLDELVPENDDGSDGGESGSGDPRGPGEGTEWEVEITRIDDADSMGVKFPDGTKDTIRLLGIDSPETGGWNYPTEFEGIPDRSEGWNWLAEWGKKADEWATDNLAEETVTIRTDPEADRRGDYDRLLVYLFDNGTGELSFNHRALVQGYARVYESSFSKLNEYLKLEQRARDNDVGLWSFPGDESGGDGGDGGSEEPDEPAPEPDEPEGGDGDGDGEGDDGVDIDELTAKVVCRLTVDAELRDVGGE